MFLAFKIYIENYFMKYKCNTWEIYVEWNNSFINDSSENRQYGFDSPLNSTAGSLTPQRGVWLHSVPFCGESGSCCLLQRGVRQVLICLMRQWHEIFNVFLEWNSPSTWRIRWSLFKHGFKNWDIWFRILTWPDGEDHWERLCHGIWFHDIGPRTGSGSLL